MSPDRIQKLAFPASLAASSAIEEWNMDLALRSALSYEKSCHANSLIKHLWDVDSEEKQEEGGVKCSQC